MKFKYSSVIFFSVFLLFCVGCHKSDVGRDGMGKKPVYVEITELADVKSLTPQPIESTGPIYLLDTLFFMTEIKKGIHVFNVKDSVNIKNLGFFKIPAITDFTLSGNILYADSWTDLLTIDISDLNKIKLINREKAVFDPLLFPPLYNGFFECVDLSKGAVIGWNDEFLTAALCRTL